MYLFMKPVYEHHNPVEGARKYDSPSIVTFRLAVQRGPAGAEHPEGPGQSAPSTQPCPRYYCGRPVFMPIFFF